LGDTVSTSEEQVRELIAAQAGEWFVAHRAGSLDAAARHAFHAWLTASPIHVEEYLGVAFISRNLPAAAADPDMPLEVILDRVREESATATMLETDSPPPLASQHAERARRWQWAAVAASLAAVGSAVLWWSGERTATEHYATRHGEQTAWQLTDHSTLRLNTDSTVTVRYTRSERLIELERGEAVFEVAHQSGRPFRVVAGTVNVLALGTTFDVYRQAGSTLVTVVEGHVVVSTIAAARESVTAGAGEQVRVGDDQPPTRAMPADLQRSTAWLHRQIVFEREPLALVAAEFNRYSALPIEIETPALRSLQVSGIFSVDDTETFLDFLRSFDGVTVTTTSTRIRVFERVPAAPARPSAEQR
jgi:transmembrane sensor